MASKLVKNATAPTPTATAAMMVTTAAWKRRSHASAAWTLGSTMLGIGCELVLIVGLRLGSAAGEAARLVVGIGLALLGSAGRRRRGTAAERDGGDGQAQPGDGDQGDDGHDRAGGHAGDGEHQGDGGGGVHAAQGLQRQHRRRNTGRLGLVDVVDLHWRALVGWLEHGGSSLGQLG